MARGKYRRNRRRLQLKRRRVAARMGIGMARGLSMFTPKYSKPSCFKRLGLPILIANGNTGNGGPNVVTDGNGSCQIGSWASGYMNTAQVGGSLQFKLESSVDYGDFAQLFDRYKITGVKLKFLYQHNIGSVGSTTGAILPTLNYSFDGDDNAVPTAQIEVLKKQYCHTKVMNANEYFSLYIKPRITTPTTLAGSYTTSKAKWIDCNSGTAVPHFGIKFWLSGWTPGTLSSAVLNAFTIQPTYYFALKDTQ